VVVPPVLEPLGAPGPVTLSAAAVFSLLPVLRARRQAAQQAYRDSPVAYLLRLSGIPEVLRVTGREPGVVLTRR
jgi:hypothetical protein